MRAVVQRVRDASVAVDARLVGSIGRGVLVYLGVASGDSEKDAEYLADKVANLRIFMDSEEKMNLSCLDVGGAALVISQFTLLADARKGRRPSYSEAAEPETARVLYEYFVQKLEAAGIVTSKGQFQATMDVSYVNEGPITILLDSKKKF
ncbi:D-aminoacyl-tRNA deacylase [Treponema sp.]